MLSWNHHRVTHHIASSLGLVSVGSPGPAHAESAFCLLPRTRHGTDGGKARAWQVTRASGQGRSHWPDHLRPF